MGYGAKTKIRLQQLTGTIGNNPGDIRTNASAVTLAGIAALKFTDLSGSLGLIASAMGRIHGKSSNEAFNNAAGTFYTAVLPDDDASQNLGSTTKEWAEVHTNAINSAAALDINATTGVTVDGTAVSIDGTDDSNLTVTGATKDLTLAVVGGGAQVLKLDSAGTGADALDINATAGGIDIDAAGAIAIDTSAGGISLDATVGNANFSTAASASTLTLEAAGGSTNQVVITSAGTGVNAVDINATAGGVAVDAAGALSFDGVGASNLTTIGALTVSGSAGLNLLSTDGEIDITTTGAVDINSAAGTWDSSAGIALEGAAASSFKTSAGAITVDAEASTLELNGHSGVSIVGNAGEVDITTTALLDINSAQCDVDASGDLMLESAKRLQLTSSVAGATAIHVNNSAAAGGMTFAAKTGGFNVSSTGVFGVVATGGDVSLMGTGYAVSLTSTEAAADAIKLNASNAAGGIDVDAGTGGIDILTTGVLSIDSSATAAAANLSHVGAAGQDLTVDCSAGSLNLTGGEADAAAVRIQADNAAGGIDVDCGTGGYNNTSTGALALTSSLNHAKAVQVLASAGGIDIDAVGAAGEDIDIKNAGGSLVFTSTEDATDSLTFEGFGYSFNSGDQNDSYAFNDAPLQLAQITAPTTTTNRLYNVGGSLTWNGTAIGGTTSAKYSNIVTASLADSTNDVQFSGLSVSGNGAKVQATLLVYANGQLLTSGSAGGTNGATTFDDYSVVSTKADTITFNFNLEADDALMVVDGEV